MFSGYIRRTAALLFLLILISSASGCSLFNREQDHNPLFDAPYINNYYVNKHTPTCVSGNMTVYKYDSFDSPIVTMGGHDYRGGLIIENGWSSADLGCIELPLGKKYKHISFVIGGNYALKKVSIDSDGQEIYQIDHSYIGSYPTLKGQNEEARAGVQFLIDGNIADEVLISSYDVEKRFTFNVSGADKFTLKVMADTGMNGIPVMELTVWENEVHPTGYISEPPSDTPAKLIRDIRPYLIPARSSSIYYPSYTGGNSTVFMAGTEYTDVLLSTLHSDLLNFENEEIYFNLEGKYSFLTFTAGASNITDNSIENSAQLTIYADGKIIFEELFSSKELQRTFTVELSKCKQLKITWVPNTVGDVFGDSGDSSYAISDAYVGISKESLSTVEHTEGNFPKRPVKIISELGVFDIESDADNPIFDGKEESRTFSMAGRQYAEGIVLLSSNTILMGNKTAGVSFNLGGNYSTVSFVCGHIENIGIYKNETLQIFADGVLLDEIDVNCTDLPRKYTLNVSGCRLLRFVSGLEYATSMQRPALGIANLTAYPGESNNTDLFANIPEELYPENADLIETFGFYDVRNPRTGTKIGGVSTKDGYFDGSERSNFRIDGKSYTKGIVLHTHTDTSPDMEAITDSGLLGSAVSEDGLSVITLSSKGEIHISAFALANISDGGYKTLSFNISCLKTKSNEEAESTTDLFLYADGKRIKEISLSDSMNTLSYTVDISECRQIMFWLNCSREDAPSHYYAIHDIILSK